MQIGVHLPHVGEQATAATIAAFARRMEELGFDSLWVSDHVVIPRDYASRYPYHASGHLGWTELPLLEPVATLLYVAGITSRVKLGTTVLVLPMRNPVLLAKMLATLDHLSGGRLILGVGVGWLKEEFEALAEPFAQRGARMDEYIEVLKRLWTQDDPSFAGRYYTLGNVAAYPKPVQQPHPPIYIGGNTDPALRRAARVGDSWHAAGSTPDEIEAALPKFHAYLHAAGRTPSQVPVTVRIPVFSGNDEHTLGLLRRYQELGVSHLCLETGYRNMDRAYATLEHVARVLRPQI